MALAIIPAAVHCANIERPIKKPNIKKPNKQKGIKGITNEN